MKYIRYILLSCIIVLLIPCISVAESKEATIKLNFVKQDSLDICKVNVTSEDKPVKDVTVKVYIKRMFGLLPVKDVTTDENGAGEVTFPNDVPGDEHGMLNVLAKIEDDDNYANAKVSGDINWGIPKKTEDVEMARSLSASRGRAPIYFIVASLLIIAGVWGTLIYAVLSVFKIRTVSSLNKKTSIAK